jgi:hypothetical protein
MKEYWKICDLTDKARADLIDRLRNRPGHVTAAEKAMLANLLDSIEGLTSATLTSLQRGDFHEV